MREINESKLAHRPHKLMWGLLRLTSSRKMYYTLHPSQDFLYPPNVGYPIGGPAGSQFAVIEMHYDNPRLMSGEQDIAKAHELDGGYLSQNAFLTFYFVLHFYRSV